MVSVSRQSAASQLTSGERTIPRHWANIALWVQALTKPLSVTLQQQVTSGSGIELWWQPIFDQLLRFAVSPAVVLSFFTYLDADQDVRAVRGDRRHR